ncbi:MAG: hypothetical protein GXO07_05335 [Crenarchaeota archaeon]|nr:hypothetical protein [Thermoproteota archaeon]
MASVETVAKVTFLLAVALAITSAVLLRIVLSAEGVHVLWNEQIVATKGRYSALVMPSPFSRPSIMFFSGDSAIALEVLSFNDVLSLYKGRRLSELTPKIYVSGGEIVIDYGPFRRSVSVSEEGVRVAFEGFDEGIVALTLVGVEEIKVSNSTVELLNVSAPLNLRFDVVIRFSGCSAEPVDSYGVSGSRWAVRLALRCAQQAEALVSVRGAEGPLEGRSLLGAVTFAIYFLPLWIALAALAAWKLWLSKNLRSFKGALVFYAILSLIAGLSGHHWDMLMAYEFGRLAYNLQDPYAWTYENSLLIREKLPIPQAFFPGYAYLPHLMAFFYPLYALYQILIGDTYYLTVTPEALRLADQYSLLFKTNTFLYYALAHAYYSAFLFLTAYLIAKYYSKEKAFLFLYSFLPLTIIIEWGMYECFMLPFLVLSLALLKKEGRRAQFLSGLLWSLGSSKIYPFLSAPALLVLSKSRIAWIAGAAVAQVPTLYFLLREPVEFLSCTVLFHMNRNIGDINYFPSFLGNPVELLWLGSVGSWIEVALLLTTYYLVWKRRPEPEAAAALPMVPFLLFNRLVSPQHYLTFATLALLAGEALAFAYAGLLIFLHVNMVRPTVPYLAYHWLEVTFTRGFFTYGYSWFILALILRVVPSLVWPLVFVSLASVLTLFYVKALRGQLGGGAG